MHRFRKPYRACQRLNRVMQFRSVLAPLVLILLHLLRARTNSLKAASSQNSDVSKQRLPRKDPGPVEQPGEACVQSQKRKKTRFLHLLGLLQLMLRNLPILLYLLSFRPGVFSLNVAPLKEHASAIDSSSGSISTVVNVNVLSAETSLNLGSSHDDDKGDIIRKFDVDQVNSRNLLRFMFQRLYLWLKSIIETSY
ncbi:uncharacterized protein LOC110879610 isoform X1 [Helianthus annuus]|uniref:uncharacterized protein LOC110879610 isoform X1 n=1 Tax=Helianthus annuus TaxID=4232 RepID=UPI0016533DE0|nr:uncharacterized protein LOC110879610 isoform X1 [Helianthus annuus]XP_035833769.1 uncharacterized protein LOC110879610 isoform X1 [Helianthus annuus]